MSSPNHATPSTGRQTTAVEFTVTGTLDGTTVVPPELVASEPAGDPQQLHRFTVENLGLIDVDFLVEPFGPERRGARGNRLITSLYVNIPVPIFGNLSVQVVDAIDDALPPVVLETIPTVAGSVYYNRDGIYIPQGAMLRLLATTGSGAQPIKVRYHYCSVDCSGAAKVISALDGGGQPGPPGPPGPSLSAFAMGSGTLSGFGDNPRYLWPGSSRDLAQGEFVYFPAPADGIIRSFIVTQQGPTTVPAAVMEYMVITSVPQPTSIITVGSEVSAAQINDGLNIPVTQGEPIAVAVTRSNDHPTMNDIIANILFEIT